MKKEHISDALNMLNDDIIEETNNVRTNAKPKRKWVKWGVVAACLCLAVTIAIPMLHHKGGPGTQDPVQNIAALEYNGKFYEAVKLPEVLEKYGLPPEITADMAGEHISYLKSDGLTSSYTGMHLLFVMAYMFCETVTHGMPRCSATSISLTATQTVRSPSFIACMALRAQTILHPLQK